MYRNKISYIGLMFVIILTSCVKRYDPEIKSTDAVKFVITGQVNRGDAVQRINISTTSLLAKPTAIPVTGCDVKIIDGKGNTYLGTDVWNGNYDIVIPESELQPGNTFMLDIQVPGSDHIVSDFDQIQDCPDVDSVYYITQKLPTSSPVEFTEGIQFYVDLNAQNFSCRNFRFEAVETWEYHTLYPIEWWYNGRLHHTLPPDSSKMVCWRTSSLRDIYMLSTKNLSENKYNQFPLHFVDNASSSRLVYGYSLLLRQYALSDGAADYWEKIRVNSQEQGGLYESQPLSVKGNLHDVTNPEQDVLGFFGTATVKQKRIFVKDVPDLQLEYVFNCVINSLPWGGLAGTYPRDWPIYLPAHTTVLEDTVIYSYDAVSIDHECVDCTSTVGGTTVKPDFWPY
jgi:hypothetical protein